MKRPRISAEEIQAKLDDKKREADAIIEVLANWQFCDGAGKTILVACALNYAKKYGLPIWK